MLKICTYPDSILTTPAKDVQFPLDSDTSQLINDMWEVVKANGVGLAAPQVGVSKKICIVNLSSTEKGKEAKDILLINPRITFSSQIQHEMVEGCLSFPKEYYKIIRPANITVEYQDQNNRSKKLNASKWLSRVIQHEIDHLNGQIFINKGGLKIDPNQVNTNDIVD
ncbi:MAG: peptide deformylase [Thermales bacterium]|nr:peptide deformylase [Thermales bacterium]